MDDTISRQAAIKKIDSYLLSFAAIDRNYCEGLRDAQRLVNSTPSAQPERHWIPVTERLPEEHEWIGTKTFGTTISDKVYVTFESPKGERFTKHLSFQNGKVPSFEQRKIDAWHKGSVPIAWMPLPEPYREEEHDED